MRIFFSIMISLIIFPSLVLSQNTIINSFSTSKKQLLKVYKINPITLYCGCTFNGKTPNFSSCGYIPKKNNKRANRVEWEHIVPAYVFGIYFSEWTIGHPKCVKKNGKKYKGRRLLLLMINIGSNFFQNLILTLKNFSKERGKQT